MSISVRRPITVKTIVTELLKDSLLVDLQNALDKVEQDLHQIDFQGKRLALDIEKQNPQRLAAFKQQVESEKQKRLEAKNDLLKRMETVQVLELGQEIIHSTIEGSWELQVGQSWKDLQGAEIVLKDDVVIEIRDPLSPGGQS